MSKSTIDQLRSVRNGMRGVREERRMPTRGFELREVSNGAGGTYLLCQGYASTTCVSREDDSNAYELEDSLGPWLESIVRGAFTKTLAENADVAFLVNHGGVTMARTKPGTLQLAEDSTGLHYEARLNPTRPDVQILRAAVEDGAVDESSFAFRVTRQEWNEDYTRRWITEINLNKGDVSPVNFGANDHTADYPLTVRDRDRDRAGRGRSTLASVEFIVLPDYTTRARVDLARLGYSRPSKRHTPMPGVPDAASEARRQLEAARRRAAR